MQRRLQSRMATLPRLRIHVWGLLLFHTYSAKLRFNRLTHPFPPSLLPVAANIHQVVYQSQPAIAHQ